jgi:hypothetical protein
MKIEQIPTEKLIPYARNAKKHDAAQVSKLAGSIREFGFNNPVLIDKDNGIIAGHGRVMAAQKLELKDVPCIRLGHLTDTQRRAYILADNRLAEVNSGWDEELLKLEIKDIDWGELKEISVDDFQFGEIDFGEEKEEPVSDADAEPQIDKAEELRAKWGVEPGQLWELGDHRLLCGDSTKKEDVDRVMGGEKAKLCLTDPPYGIGEAYQVADTENNLEKILPLFLPLAQKVSEVILLTPGNRHMWKYPKPEWVLAWFVQAGVGANPWGFTSWNAIFAYGKDPYLQNRKGSRPDAFVKTEVSEKTGHPTPKPIGVWNWMLERGSLQKGDFVFDPFLGSGTTIIACEQLGRKCRAIEISPAYVAVAIQRWADATGKTPRKL